MRRRLFIALLGSAVVMPIAARAQQGGRIPRVGWLSPGSAASDQAFLASFRDGLRQLGWVVGQNITIEPRWAEGKFERLPDLAMELVQLKPDVIVASVTQASLAAKRATTAIPIVMVGVGDPLGSGLVASLARPGGNATGWTTILPDLGGKLLGLIREAVPSASRIVVLANPTNPASALALKAMRDQAPSLGVIIQSVEVPTPASLDAAFSTMGSSRSDALVTIFDTVTLSTRGRIVEFAARHRIPAIYQLKEFADAGGLMSYGPKSMVPRTAIYVERILKGAKPADLPLEQPTTFELVINLKAARALGLTIPPSLLARADRVIE